MEGVPTKILGRATLTTFKKYSIVTAWNPYFYCLGGRFLTVWSSDIISRLVLSNTKQRKLAVFDENHGLALLKKNTVWWLCKIYIFIV